VVSLAGVVEQRKGALEEGEGGADRWGRGVSDRGKKKRREGDGGRCGEGRNGSVGRWAERGRLGSFFKNPFQIKSFQSFSQHFINFLDFTQATKNHA
jgi:hypothetical protein